MSGKAIFLDRDGTIIFDVGYPKNPQRVLLIPGVVHALRQFIFLGFKLIVISNQSGIGRRIITVNEMNQVNAKLVSILNENQIFLDGIYFCPHSPEEQCNCRKPAPDMILKAATELDINLSLSFMVGDKLSDIEAGKRAGCGTILLCGEELNEFNVRPDFTTSKWDDVLMYIAKR